MLTQLLSKPSHEWILEWMMQINKPLGKKLPFQQSTQINTKKESLLDEFLMKDGPICSPAGEQLKTYATPNETLINAAREEPLTKTMEGMYLFFYLLLHIFSSH